MTTGRIVQATAIALVTAVLILIAFVLPAEYGIDPFGTGHALGLTQLAAASDSAGVGAAGLAKQTETLKSDAVEFTLKPAQTIEYKYRLDKGASMLFAWRATAPVVYDFHTEPEGTASSASQSFEKGESADVRGTYVAPYNGIHGWYWENKTSAPVTITLTSAGFYYAATEILQDGSRKAHELKQD